MKLLIYSHFFAPGVGGVETIVRSLAEGLAQLRSPSGSRECDVTLITETPAGNFRDIELPFPIIRQPSSAQLWKHIRQADVLHIAGPALLPLFFARLTGTPTLVEHHGYQAICLNGLLIHQPDQAVCPGHFQAKRYGQCLKCQRTEMPALKAFIELLKGFARSWLVRRAQKNIAVSDHVVRRSALPNTVRIYHGITVPESVGLSPSPTRATEKICFAFVGRFVPEKGIPVLLEACGLLAAENLDFQIRLIGDGPIRSELDASIHSKNLQQYVSITGYLSGAQLAEALRYVAVVVMPSVWEETAGLSAIEQMFRGRLVIASDIAGLAEMVGDGGLLFPAGDPKALAACMRSVIVSPAQIDTLGKKARDRALQLFPQDRMIQQHFELYRDVATRTSRSDNS
jgi:glycosyltransferase involved in cell wall biosynthesis